MALFGNEEKKLAKEQAKLDAQAAKELKILQKYGVDSLRDPRDIASVKKIASELMGTALSEAGLKFSMKGPDITIPISYQRAIMEQNFIIIRQLDELITVLKHES